MICPCGGRTRVLDTDTDIEATERIRCCLRCGKLTKTREEPVRSLPGKTKNKRAAQQKSTG